MIICSFNLLLLILSNDLLLFKLVIKCYRFFEYTYKLIVDDVLVLFISKALDWELIELWIQSCNSLAKF